jgi:hypothetical protein
MIKTLPRYKLLNTTLPAMLAIALMAGCEQSGQTGDPGRSGPQAGQPVVDERPLGQVIEFDGFTLRANVTRTEVLPDAMAREYGIEPAANLALLNLVILEKRPDQQPAAVEADVDVHYESLVGHTEVIDMRAAEADGYVSYIGTLDASAQRVFRLVIEAKPAGADEPLEMAFEVQLDTLDTE